MSTRTTLYDLQISEGDGESKGLGLWSAAVLLADHMRLNAGLLAHAAVVLEIGAGCGLVGLVAARSEYADPSIQVFLTDNDAATLDNLRVNARANVRLGATVVVAPLDFDHPHASSDLIPKADVILAADVLYSGMRQSDDAAPDLLTGDWDHYENNANVARTLAYYLKPSGKALIATQPTRGDDTAEFITHAERLGLAVRIDSPAADSIERVLATPLRYGDSEVEVGALRILTVVWADTLQVQLATDCTEGPAM